MKLYRISLLMIVLLLASSVAAMAYTSWTPRGGGSTDIVDDFDAIVDEFEFMLDQAVRHRSGHPDFLADLETLLDDMYAFRLALLDVVKDRDALPRDVDVIADPGNLVSYRSHTDQRFYFRVTGTSQGTIWGTDIYTDDSRLAKAAVHAGIIDVGQTAVIEVAIRGGQTSYTGSTRHGITSSSYGRWSGSYEVIRRVPSLSDAEVDVIEDDPGRLTSLRSRTGETFFFRITGSTSGSVWGTDVYTDDSQLAKAAVHAGVLAIGETGVVAVTILPGQDGYEGSTRNGVTTFSYGRYGGSFRVARHR